MSMTRREAIRTAVAASLAGTSIHSQVEAKPQNHQFESPINIILQKDYIPPTEFSDTGYSFRLSRAVLDLLESHFSNQNLPIWYKPFNRIEIERRVTNIVYWILQGVQMHRDIYPVDPAWVLAQIMHESYFYEFCVSRAGAVGICQFMPATAREYGMICAGDLSEHSGTTYKLPAYVTQMDVYEELRKDLRTYIRENKHLDELTIENISALYFEKNEQLEQTLTAWLAFQAQKKAFYEQIDEARDRYTDYLKANFEGRDIFNENDLQFLLGFDERVTYKKPVFSMVKMLARSLRARNGNIIAAAAGYNAGLSRTQAEGIYKKFGQIPNFNETVTYVSRILINHYEIVSRI